MNSLSISLTSPARRRTCIVLLAFSLAFGLGTGVQASGLLPREGLALLPIGARSPAAPLALATMTLLPFLLTAAAAALELEGLAILVCLGKGFCFGLLGAALGAAFGSAGWLARLLFLFTDWVCLPLLCWFCIRRLLGRQTLWRDLAVCAVLALMAAWLDCCAISPFLASLL